VGEKLERVAEASVVNEPLPSPEASLAERERLSQLRRAVRDLAPPYRVVVERCWLDERSPEDVARELGIRPSGVRTRLVRARRQLAAAAW
jgi:RNA polymerase sigma factor (sigma-70 family)